MTRRRSLARRAVLVTEHLDRRDALLLHLRALRFAVEVGAGGGELESLVDTPCDLVLVDLTLGSERTAAVCRSVRDSAHGRDVVLLAVADGINDDDVAGALAHGADDVVFAADDGPCLSRRFTVARHRRDASRREGDVAEALQRLERALDAAGIGFAATDMQGRVTFANHAHAAMHGYSVEELAGRPASVFAPRMFKGSPNGQRATELAGWSGETTDVRKDGSELAVHLVATPEHDRDGQPVGMVMTCREITERRLYDPVTGLPNRALVLDRLDQALEMSRRPGGRSFAVLALELDRFPHVSSSYGAAAAAGFLASAAARLKEGLRSTDTLAASSPTLAHVDGGRFTILLHDVSDPRDAVRVARRLQAGFETPLLVEGAEVFSSASLGVVAGVSDYQAATDVLRDAETALSRARSGGGGRTVVFDPEMHASIVATLKLENELHHAIERRELRVHYQPILSLADGSLVGFEALVRWQHPEGRLLYPDEFIPLAEQTGLVVPVDRWVIETVCRQIRTWRGRFGRKFAPVVSVNLSGRQFNQPDLTVAIDRSLRSHGLYGRAIKLEITESVIMQQAEFAAEMLSQLHDLDVKLSIDDFGTGYSSFSYLRRFEIDTLKIDRSFVSRMDRDPESAEIVRATVGLGKSLGKNVIAEGVENCNQVLMLRDLECPLAQGFYFAPGLDSDQATALIGRQHVGDLFTV